MLKFKDILSEEVKKKSHGQARMDICIGLLHKAMNKLTIEEKNRLNIIKGYKFSPAGNFGYRKAEVTKGGINCNEIDNNMQSKLQKNLYFIGECLDITGELGGYNFQSAFSSAFVCSKDLI